MFPGYWEAVWTLTSRFLFRVNPSKNCGGRNGVSLLCITAEAGTYLVASGHDFHRLRELFHSHVRLRELVLVRFNVNHCLLGPVLLDSEIDQVFGLFDQLR